ncbi:MAG: PilZ domain-containing protein [Deltaproteobacteria bacterium]|nr:PilZ domain-containing protein [Deltaproteobacteria bacterium]
MKTDNHRRHERHPVSIPLVFRDAVELRQEYTENISRSGMFVKTGRLLEHGDMVTLTIEIPDTHEKLEVDGYVEFHRQPDAKHAEGVGIQFIAISPDGWKALERYLDRLDQRH